MENIQEKLEYLTNFGQKSFLVEFRGQPYFIVESGRLQGGDRECQKDFFLFDENGKQIGYLYLGEVMMSEAEREWEKMDGVLVVPADFFLLSDIEITDRNLRQKGLASMLLNWATKEMCQISKDKEIDIPLLFIRQNSNATFPFYDKWGAVLNQDVVDDKIGSSCYMRIDHPQPKSEYEVKILAEQEKKYTEQKQADGKQAGGKQGKGF